MVEIFTNIRRGQKGKFGQQLPKLALLTAPNIRAGKNRYPPQLGKTLVPNLRENTYYQAARDFLDRIQNRIQEITSTCRTCGPAGISATVYLFRENRRPSLVRTGYPGFTGTSEVYPEHRVLQG